MYIFDFDDTLFNTQAFKHARLQVLKKIGVSEELYKETYVKARNDADGDFVYSDKRHAQMCALHGIDEEKAYEALHSVTKRVKDFLFEDAIDVLGQVKKLGKPMILLSLGDPDYQEVKVKGSGIHDYFDRVFMVKRSKENVIKELLDSHKKQEPVWFINDKIEETQDIVSQFPQLQVVLKVSKSYPIELYKISGLPYVQTLKEFLSYDK
ncbi:MAG: HAD family hydrolase [Candidatus Magasanikbacteria bacterium]|jgi:phosphoglycolate phosphatase-like HAD superfamily hydrolase|nr:HAD family hydrolase [Candidatus Magasanikbacteria bacterium]MBT4072027.1 HAD family hydrolase [Candidatus Magasanikbacteria bacterium]